MSFVDQSSGWRWPAMGGALLVQALLIAGAGAAFHAAQQEQGAPEAMAVAVFHTPAPPEAASPRTPAEQQGKGAPPRAAQAVALPESGPVILVPASSRSDLGQAEPLVQSRAAPPAAVVRVDSPPPMSQRQATADDALAGYTQQIRALIMARRPLGESRRGDVTLFLKLNLSGQLQECSVAQGSGDVRLDRTALRMVRQAAPFPAAPDGLRAEQLNFSLQLRFH